jgi:hypothetical protein
LTEGGTTPPLARKLPQRFADLFASPWGIFTQLNSRQNTITNNAIITIRRHNILIFLAYVTDKAKMPRRMFLHAAASAANSWHYYPAHSIGQIGKLASGKILPRKKLNTCKLARG